MSTYSREKKIIVEEETMGSDGRVLTTRERLTHTFAEVKFHARLMPIASCSRRCGDLRGICQAVNKVRWYREYKSDEIMCEIDRLTKSNTELARVYDYPMNFCVLGVLRAQTE